jgi:hypothetical protein
MNRGRRLSGAGRLVIALFAMCMGCTGASSDDSIGAIDDGRQATSAVADESGGAIDGADVVANGAEQDGAEQDGEPAVPPVPADAHQPPPASPAQAVDRATRGNVIFYSISEVDRPIYGWKDFVTVTYCADGRFALESQGERTTTLDITDRRADRGTGTWQIYDRPDGTVAVELAFDDGRTNGFVIRVSSTGAFDHGPAVRAQQLRPAGC